MTAFGKVSTACYEIGMLGLLKVDCMLYNNSPSGFLLISTVSQPPNATQQQSVFLLICMRITYWHHNSFRRITVVPLRLQVATSNFMAMQQYHACMASAACAVLVVLLRYKPLRCLLQWAVNTQNRTHCDMLLTQQVLEGII
jgi:hypothetical protein